MNYNEYEDKVALNENAEIPNINKVTDDDMNYIKYNLPHVSNEVEEDYKVNLIRSKNLYNDSTKKSYYWLNINGTISTSNDPNIVSDFIKVEKGKSYTFSGITYDLRVCSYNTYNDTSSFKTVLLNTSSSLRTIVADADYIVFAIGGGNATTLTNVQVEEGSAATTYEPFTYNEVIVNNEKYTDTINVDSAVDSRSRVNVLHSNNLFNKDSFNKLNGYYVSESQSTISQSGQNMQTLYISIVGGKTYTVSKVAGVNFRCATTQVLPAPGVTVADQIERNTATSITITTSSSAKYLCVSYYSNTETQTEQTVLNSIMINEGSTALPYEPYITPSINVDGDTIYKRTSAINGTLSSDYSISASNTYEKIPFNTTTIIGSNLSLNNNVIVIGEGIDYIDISSSIYIQAVGGTGVKYIKILKNNSTIDLKYVTVSANAYYMFTSTNIIPVSENDTIEIQAYGLQNDKIVKNSSIVVKTI